MITYTVFFHFVWVKWKKNCNEEYITGITVNKVCSSVSCCFQFFFLLLVLNLIQRYKKNPVKLLLFADDVILYIENPKDVTRKLLELINEFGKVVIQN